MKGRAPSSMHGVQAEGASAAGGWSRGARARLRRGLRAGCVGVSGDRPLSMGVGGGANGTSDDPRRRSAIHAAARQPRRCCWGPPAGENTRCGARFFSRARGRGAGRQAGTGATRVTSAAGADATGDGEKAGATIPGGSLIGTRRAAAAWADRRGRGSSRHLWPLHACVPTPRCEGHRGELMPHEARESPRTRSVALPKLTLALVRLPRSRMYHPCWPRVTHPHRRHAAWAG